ncbi:MAG: alkaline phosphatase family protein [Deltaproteobacteria bacterium]|nr:MAG: alkaline phosphatase family protein [Deltaproteobacteria bacterium]
MVETPSEDASGGGALRRYLWYATQTVAGLAAIVSVALWIAFLGLNPALRAPAQAGWLLGYLLLFHAALLLPIGVATAALLAAAGRRSRGRLGRRAVGTGVAVLSLFALAAINAALRFTLTYTVYRDERLITPLGVLNHAVLLGVLALIVAQLWRAGARPPERVRSGRARIAVAVAAAIAIAVVVVNRVDELPRTSEVGAIDAGTTRPAPADWGAAVTPRNVLVLGFDGLSWFVIDSMLREGRLPNLGMLVRSGARAPLVSEIPTTSPIIWNAVATGRRAADHGIFGFRRFRLPGMTAPISRGPMLGSMNWWNGLNRFLSAAGARGWIEMVPYFSTDRGAPAVWDVARHHGLSIGVAGWFNTWPVPALDDGSYMISKFWSEAEIEALLDDRPFPPPPVEADSPVWREPWLEREVARSHDQVQVATRLHRRFQPRLSLNYWHFTDGVQHSYWRGDARGKTWYVPRDADYRRFSRHVTDAYALVDRWIADFLDALEPGTLVLVVSDHGYAFDGYEHHRAPDGVFVAAGPGVVPGHVLDPVTLYDVAPTILAVLGLPVSEELEGRVLAEMFRPGAAPSVTRVSAYSWYEPGTLEEEKRMIDLENETWEKMRALGYVN